MLPPDWNRIQRGKIVNATTLVGARFIMNPNQLQAGVAANWEKQAAQGASYERLHFKNTGNATFSLTATYNRILFIDQFRGEPLPSTKDLVEGFEWHRHFLLSLCYPQGRANDVMRRSPPHALFVWPNYIAIRCVVMSVQFTDTQFAADGYPLQWTAALALEEYRTYRLHSHEILQVGWNRRTRGGKIL